ncbi:hypothetical protein COOONC_05605 [Cooperia oncophora]
MLNSHASKCVVSFQPISPRIAVITLGGTVKSHIHARKHQLTWRNPSGHDSAVLDYVLINSRYRSSLKDVRAMRGPDCGSDHYLLRAVVQLLHSVLSRVNAQVDRMHTFEAGGANSICCQISLLRSRKWERWTRKNGRLQKSLPNVLHNCAQFCADGLNHGSRTKHCSWLCFFFYQLVDKRRKVKLTNGTTYQLLSKELRKRLKTEREAYWNAVAEELEESASKHEYRMPYQILRRLCGKTRALRLSAKRKSGKLVKSERERLQRWREFFIELYSHELPTEPFPEPVPIEMPQEPTHEAAPIFVEDKEKRLGDNGVTAEAIKAGGEVLVQRLHRLMCRVWQTEAVPTTWKRSIIVPIHKKGDITECKN